MTLFDLPFYQDTMTKNGVSTSEYGYHSLANAKDNALELAGA